MNLDDESRIVQSQSNLGSERASFGGESMRSKELVTAVLELMQNLKILSDLIDNKDRPLVVTTGELLNLLEREKAVWAPEVGIIDRGSKFSLMRDDAAWLNMPILKTEENRERSLDEVEGACIVIQCNSKGESVYRDIVIPGAETVRIWEDGLIEVSYKGDHHQISDSENDELMKVISKSNQNVLKEIENTRNLKSQGLLG